MKLADELRQAQDLEYPEFVRKYGTKLEQYTKNQIKNGYKCSMLFGNHIKDVTIGFSIDNKNFPFLKKWIENNGFSISYSTNSYGVRSINWEL